MPLDERPRLLEVEVEQIRPVAARDLDHVAEPAGCDEPYPRALALGDGVDDDRGAVGEELQVGCRDAALA